MNPYKGMEVREGWVELIGEVPSDSEYQHGKIYPCYITESGRILFPKYGNYPFTNGALFKIVDPFLININKILE